MVWFEPRCTGEAGPLLAMPAVLRRIRPTPVTTVPPRLPHSVPAARVCSAAWLRKRPVFQVTEHFRVPHFCFGDPW